MNHSINRRPDAAAKLKLDWVPSGANCPKRGDTTSWELTDGSRWELFVNDNYFATVVYLMIHYDAYGGTTANDRFSVTLPTMREAAELLISKAKEVYGC